MSRLLVRKMTPAERFRFDSGAKIRAREIAAEVARNWHVAETVEDLQYRAEVGEPSEPFEPSIRSELLDILPVDFRPSTVGREV